MTTYDPWVAKRAAGITEDLVAICVVAEHHEEQVRARVADALQGQLDGALIEIEKRVAAAVAELTAQHERETAVLRRMFNDDRRENERLRELNTRARWLLRCASTIGGPALWPEWHDAVTELLMKRLGEEGLL